MQQSKFSLPVTANDVTSGLAVDYVSHSLHSLNLVYLLSEIVSSAKASLLNPHVFTNMHSY